MSATDALRRAKWRESVGLEVPGSTPVKYFDSFGEFLDDQVRNIVSEMPPEVRAGFEKLRDELKAETPEWNDPDLTIRDWREPAWNRWAEPTSYTAYEQFQMFGP